MRALAARGNTAEALRVSEQLRTLVREELGIAFCAETLALHAELLTARVGTGWANNAPLAPFYVASVAKLALYATEPPFTAGGRASGEIVGTGKRCIVAGGVRGRDSGATRGTTPADQANPANPADAALSTILNHRLTRHRRRLVDPQDREHGRGDVSQDPLPAQP